METKEVSEEDQTSACFPSDEFKDNGFFAVQNRILHIYLDLVVLQLTHPAIKSAGILEQSMGARNLVGIGLSYRPSRLHRLAESIPGLLKS